MLLSLVEAPTSPFEPPSYVYRLLSSPLKLITHQLYSLILTLRGPSFHPPPSPIRLVCISDTHTYKPSSLPPGDVLIHAGDLTNLGTAAEIQDQINWLSSLPHTHKIVIAGNHDSYLDARSRPASDMEKSLDWKDIHYLQHGGIALTFPEHNDRRIAFWGGPQIPECGGPEFAFQYQRHEDAWSGTVPRETDVLITHTPPRHHLDLPSGLGCAHLLKEVWRVRPRVHVFGHVHAGYGHENLFWDETQKAYERVGARRDRGIIMDLISVRGWLDIWRVAYHGILGILWTRVWGADSGGCIMINAALTYRSTGKLGNLPQVVDV
ncbi:hypothetical protein MMC20_002171 [Loxospora ochrophaea]|nr:hypothetical protein [Loxospora ochrophaea]